MKYAVLIRPIIHTEPQGPHIVNCLDFHMQAVGRNYDEALYEMMRLLSLNEKMADQAKQAPAYGHPKPTKLTMRYAREGAGKILQLTVERKERKRNNWQDLSYTKR